jgi:hypothetical protein
MRLIEVDPGRWRLEFDIADMAPSGPDKPALRPGPQLGGLGLEVILLFSRSVAFWRWGGELVAEVNVGES